MGHRRIWVLCAVQPAVPPPCVDAPRATRIHFSRLSSGSHSYRTSVINQGFTDIRFLFLPQPSEFKSLPPTSDNLLIPFSCTSWQAQFEALKRLLSLLPSLSQLHLSNGVFFGRGASADAISKLDTIDQCFRYPELYALLFFLRGTKVKIFAYRGVNEKREMRWMRSDVTEDFERDCWTL